MNTFKYSAGFLVAIVILFAGASPLHAATQPIKGWAWSTYDGGWLGGWIHFNGSTYGVQQDTSTGVLSGYAWATNYGWISFNSVSPNDLAGCPSGACEAKVDLVTGKVTGWARVISAIAGMANTGGQFLGWIHLSPDSGSLYGVTSGADGCWSGYAWGDQEIGYIHFAGANYKVGTAACTDVTAACTVSPSTGNINDTYTWSSTVSGGIAPYSYSWALTGATPSPPPNSSSVNARYATPGTYSGSLVVTDSVGGTSGSISCTNGSGGNTITVTPPPPTCSTLSASPNSVLFGQSTTLTWSCQDATYCTEVLNSDGFSTDPLDRVSGSDSATPSSPGTVTYGMRCTGQGGSQDFLFPPIEVRVPIATISADPTRVASGSTSTITWSATDVISCSVTGPSGTGWANVTGPAIGGSFSTGSPKTPTITKQSTYTITCQTTTSPSTVSDSVIVNILPEFEEF